MSLVHRVVLVGVGLAGVLTLSFSQAAGVARVSFIQPEKFVDVRDSAGRSEDNLKVLSQHLQTLAERYLPDGQTLQVEVLDVDLAGRIWPSRSFATDVRVVKGNIDWPRITLRYVLEDQGRVLQRGEESIADMNFMFGLAGSAAADPLRYEKRMLEHWVRSRFVAQQAATR